MTRFERIKVTKMIEEIVHLGCVVQIDNDEVTVSSRHGRTHSHHGGATLHDRMAKGLAAAREYEREDRASAALPDDDDVDDLTEEPFV